MSNLGFDVNAKTHYDQGGKAIVDLIDAEGLALSDGDLLSTDPDYIRMEEIIWSDAGRKAAIAAVEAGLPALAGVDPLLAADLGDRYHPHNAGTISAGYLTAGLTRHLGYVETKPGPFQGGVAKTGMRWRKC